MKVKVHNIMKCNIKRALEHKKKSFEEIVEDFREFIYEGVKGKYYNAENDSLDLEFFNLFDDLVIDINQTRLEEGNENFITFERYCNNKYGIWHDDAVSLEDDKDIPFYEPEHYLFFYSALFATVSRPHLKDHLEH